MRDVTFSVSLLSLAACLVLAYLLRAYGSGRARHARSDTDGGSVFVSKGLMEMGYWLFNPVAGALAALRVTPNMVTGFSLVPGLAAGVAVAFGRFGLGAVLGTIAALCDLVDGILARKLGIASDAGEVLDAVADRYVESFFLCGLIVYYRSDWIIQVLALGALLGGFMISYGTAKADAMGVTPPRGLMRRAERAIYLITASSLTGLSTMFFAGSRSQALRELPIIAAVTIVAVVANASAAQRFVGIMRVLQARQQPALVGSPRADAQGEVSRSSQLIIEEAAPARRLV